MRKKLAILGAGGHGKVIADLAELLGYSIFLFDDRWPDHRTSGAWCVSGNTAVLIQSLSEYHGVIVAIGDSNLRSKATLEIQGAGGNIATLVHPSASVSRYATIAAGSVIFANVAVNVDSRIGKGAIVNTGATIDHDCLIGDFVHVSPGAHLAGNVSVGDRSWVGIGASVRQGIHIGSDVMIGAGAAVVADVPSGTCVVGVPARPIAR